MNRILGSGFKRRIKGLETMHAGKEEKKKQERGTSEVKKGKKVKKK
jgi:hypothetical protein